MQFRDLNIQYIKYKNEIDTAIQDVLNEANFISGKEVQELEFQLSDYVDVNHCISCANGTEAMTLVMMALGVQNGDAVFVPDFTFFSTGEIVSFVGATPVFVDVDRITFNIDPEKLEDAIQRVISEGKLNPRVIIPVDLFGLPANFPEIEKIAKKYELFILEDGAQGFGGNINGKRACSFGNAATTSFFPAKPLGCYGDGGAIFTDDNRLADIIKSLKVHGKGYDKYDNIRIGVNSRLDTIQAAILKVKFRALVKHELADVNRVSVKYKEKLADNSLIELPLIPNGFYSSFAQYTIKLKNKEQRDMLQSELKVRNIPSIIYYKKPMHKQLAFSNIKFDDKDFRISNQLCETVLSLPMHPYLSDEDINYITESIKLILSYN